MGPAITFHAVDTQMKCMHKQGVGERSEPHSLYIDIDVIKFVDSIDILTVLARAIYF